MEKLLPIAMLKCLVQTLVRSCLYPKSWVVLV